MDLRLHVDWEHSNFSTFSTQALVASDIWLPTFWPTRIDIHIHLAVAFDDCKCSGAIKWSFADPLPPDYTATHKSVTVSLNVNKGGRMTINMEDDWRMVSTNLLCGIILLEQLICKSTMIDKAFFISDIQISETVTERHDKQERFHISSRTDRKSQTDWLNSSQSIASSLWLFVQSREFYDFLTRFKRQETPVRPR